ncbi:hypothetical protein SLEP1_g50334 [Rubroshorea leprosula]|uniref:Uncharacterized protein n=1 Tax=Rubroshorea leprosula TaxID=152421 RepID=A0AAV5LZS6_9ROSI|nr:hypothetical protein SLEP1_g50334 [Rubroshorea leprosula]
MNLPQWLSCNQLPQSTPVSQRSMLKRRVWSLLSAHLRAERSTRPLSARPRPVAENSLCKVVTPELPGFRSSLRSFLLPARHYRASWFQVVTPELPGSRSSLLSFILPELEEDAMESTSPNPDLGDKEKPNPLFLENREGRGRHK